MTTPDYGVYHQTGDDAGKPMTYPRLCAVTGKPLMAGKRTVLVSGTARFYSVNPGVRLTDEKRAEIEAAIRADGAPEPIAPSAPAPVEPSPSWSDPEVGETKRRTAK